jgi:hypothetical protein
MKNARTSLPYERLAKAAAYLERLDQERLSCGDPNLCKAIEERIIWRELLDLELQETDEEIERRSEVGHSFVLDGGTVAEAGEVRRPSSSSGSNLVSWGEIQQPPQADVPRSPWWRLGRFFR